jgi:peptide/nickel transport system permease protein
VASYALRRIIFFVPVLLITSMVTFFAINLVPVEPWIIFLGQDALPEQIAGFNATHGLDKPIIERYADWLVGMLQGDPGSSFLGGRSIQQEMKDRFPVTAMIMLFTVGFTVVFGMVFGTLAAVFQDSPIDYFVRFFAIFMGSIPDFYILTLLLIIPAILWNYAPPFQYIPPWEDPWHNIRQIVPPTFLLSIGGSVLLMRLARSSMLEVLRQDYIRTARSKGLAERVVILRHALRNALIPVLTIAGGLVGALLGGAIILERITALPGLGQYTLIAVREQDHAVVMALTMYAVLLIVSTNLIVDLLYAVVDPRIRYQ